MGGLEVQLFILGNVFVIGALMSAALFHWREHRTKMKSKTKSSLQPILPPATVRHIIEKAEKEYSRTVEQTSLELRHQLHTSATSLHDQVSNLGLKMINDELGQYRSDLSIAHKETIGSMQGISKDIVEHSQELRTRLLNRQAAIELQLSRQQAELEAKFIAHSDSLDVVFQKRENDFMSKLDELEKSLLNTQQQYLDKQKELNAQLEQNTAARQEQRLEQLDTQLDDAVVAFLLETLGHNVDIGAQLPYLTETLAANKEAITKELR